VVSVCCTTSTAFPKPRLDNSLLNRLADDLRIYGKVNDKQLIESLKKFKIYSDNEGLLIPIIKNDVKNPIFRSSKLISFSIADYLCENLKSLSEISLLSEIDEWKSLVVWYHEIMWSIMDIFIKTGEIKKPRAFTDSSLDCIKDLIYVTLK